MHYSYYPKNSHHDVKDYDIAKIIARDVIDIWQSVNPRLPLYNEYYIMKLINKHCFKQSKALNLKSLCAANEHNLEEKLEKLLDIAACKRDLPVAECNHGAVKCGQPHCIK